MNRRTTFKLMPFKEALSKVNDPYCCFQLARVSRHLALSPKYLSNVAKGVRNQLDACLSHYSDEFDGMPLAYSSVKLQQNYGWFIDDQPHIHCDVTADFVIFAPTIGSVLHGIVNKLGSGFAGCIVHNMVNASLILPKIELSDTSVVEGSQSIKSYADLERMHSELKLNSEVEFKVIAVHVHKQLISLTGQLISHHTSSSNFVRSGCVDTRIIVEDMKMEPVSPTKACNSFPNFTNSPVVRTLSTSKRKKADLLKQELPMDIKEEIVEIENSHDGYKTVIPNGYVNDAGSSKRSKKRKRSQSSTTDIAVIDDLITHRIKKHKHSDSEMLNNVEEDSLNSSRLKKKKHKRADSPIVHIDGGTADGLLKVKKHKRSHDRLTL